MYKSVWTVSKGVKFVLERNDTSWRPEWEVSSVRFEPLNWLQNKLQTLWFACSRFWQCLSDTVRIVQLQLIVNIVQSDFSTLLVPVPCCWCQFVVLVGCDYHFGRLPARFLYWSDKLIYFQNRKGDQGYNPMNTMDDSGLVDSSSVGTNQLCEV